MFALQTDKLIQQTMARQKQSTPLQRTTSSELADLLREENGSLAKEQNGGAKVSKVPANGAAAGGPGGHEAPESPGLLQLAICVLGIYASLYAPFFFSP